MKRFKVRAQPGMTDDSGSFVIKISGPGCDNSFAQMDRIAKLLDAVLNAADAYRAAAT